MISKMSLSMLLMAALVAGTRDYREAVNDVLHFEPVDNTIETYEYQGKPTFCKSLECPLFKVVEKKKGYELREYEPILWVQSRTKNIDYRNAQYENFMKLFRYIQGANEKKQKIPMTVPVVNKIIPGEGPACESDFTMSFYLTQNQSAFQTYPKPTEAGVKIQQTPRFRAYVRSFSGYYVRYESWRQQAEKLIADINDETKYDTSAWYTGGYDSPFTLFNRHNEIWFFAK